jgi:serine/threonine-protein kinase HipA
VNPNAVEVRIWGQRVGAVAFDDQTSSYAFSYASSWMKAGVELSPLHMPLRAGQRPFVFPGLARLTYSGLPGMLADALPDHWGNRIVDAYLQSKGIPKASINVLDRLSYAGMRGMGALEFRPTMGSRKGLGTGIDLQDLVEEARLVLEGHLTDQVLTKKALAQLIDVGASAGGARAKAVVAWNETTGALRSGQFDVPPGFEHWLLKFDGMGKDTELGGTENYGRLEYAYHLMAKAAGIRMSRCRLLEENGRAHFMTLRFDRDGNQKHHVQTLCGLDHLDFRQAGTHDYGQAFMVLDKLGLGSEAREELFRRMAFNVMARNCDDHTKNIGFLLKQVGSWSLAPAYDVIFAHNPQGAWTAQHQMGVNGRYDGIRREDFLLHAERFRVRKPEALLADVRAAVASFGQFAEEAGLKAAAWAEIAGQFQAV